MATSGRPTPWLLRMTTQLAKGAAGNPEVATGIRDFARGGDGIDSDRDHPTTVNPGNAASGF
jgi:hypothetical protein